MKEMKLYEYAIIRLVPRVEREEFINIGMILFSKEASFLKMKYNILSDKIMILDSQADIEMITKVMRGLESVCSGKALDSPIADLNPPERFRWLTAKKSTIIQTSAVHIGYSDDLEKELETLFNKLVK